MAPEAGLRPSARAGWVAATLGVALLGVASAADFIGWDALCARAPALPIAHDDFALQFYYGRLGAQLLRETGLPYGYDPNFLAGYPKNPLYYPSSAPFELALALFAYADPVLVFNRSAFALLAAAPFCFWAAASRLGLSRAGQLLATGFAAIPHRLAPSADFAPFLEASGMLAFVFASSLAALMLGLLARAIARARAADAFALALTGVLLLWTHPSSGLLIAAPAAVAYALAAPRLGARGHLALAGIAACLAAAALPLAIGFARYGGSTALGDFYTPGGRAHFAPPGGALAPLRASLPRPAWLALLPPFAGAAGFWLWWRDGRRALCGLLGSQVLLLGALAYGGAPLGLSALGPARFTLPLGQALCFPAAHALARAAGWLSRALAAAGATPRARLRRAGLAIAAAGLAFGSGLPGRLARDVRIPQLQRESGFEAHAAGLLAFLREHADPTTRLLHEETDRLQHRYYGSHLAALFPGATGALLAGGPAPHALLRQNSLRFIGGTLGGRSLRDLGDAELRRAFERYNVGQLLCWSRLARERFAALPWLRPSARFERFTLYRVEGPGSWFLNGSGAVERVGRSLHLTQVEPAEGSVLLKFHWLDTLRSRPPRALVPQAVDGSPEPFLRVLDPPRELWIGERP